MNFRGSTGYGRRFWEAGFGQWGLKMQDDISDGVAWLVKQGIADPKRVGIYGASYGGYATLAGVAFTPDLYAAAVDYVGVSNLFTFMQTIPPYWKPMLAKMQDMVGDPVRDKDRLAATSPALHADRIKTPLFVAQGAKDPRVNKDESDQMVKALKARGVNVEYMVKDNEGHGFHNDENKFEFYEAMESSCSSTSSRSRLRSRGAGRDGRIGRFRPALRRPVPGRGRAETDRAAGFHPVAAQFLGAVQRHVGAGQDAVRRIAAPVGGKPPLTVILISPSTVCSGASRSASHTRCACTNALAGSQSYISNANSRRPGGRSGRWRAPRAAPPAQNVAAPGRRWRDHGGH